MKIRAIGIVAGLAVCGLVISVPARAIDLNALKKKIEVRAKKKHDAAGEAGVGATPAAAGPSIICDARERAKLCYAFTGTKHKDEKKAKGNQMACKMFKGIYSQEGTCAAENLLGRCTILQGKDDEYILSYYSGGKIDQPRARSDCRNPKSGIHAQGAGSWSGG